MLRKSIVCLWLFLLSSIAFSAVQPADYLIDYKLGVADFAPAREAREDWGRAKVTINSSSEWQNWGTQTRAALTAWMSKEGDVKTRAAGWLHDYVDPKSGKFLYWSPEQSYPIDASPKVKAAWVTNARVYNIERMLDAARFYKLERNPIFLNWIIEQFDGYANQYANYPLSNWNGQARMFNQGLDEAIYAIKLIEVYRLVKADIPALKSKVWGDKLFTPMSDNIMASSKGGHNIAVWYASAATVISFEFPSARIDSFLTSSQGIQSLLKYGVSDDFFWFEHALPYQDYTVEALYQMLLAASLRGKLANYRDVLLTAQNMVLSPLTVRFNNFDAPTLGDSPYGRSRMQTATWQKNSRLFPFSFLPISNTQNWDSLLDSTNSLAPTLPVYPPVQTGNIPGLKLVNLIKDNWQVQARYGQNDAAHTHHDLMSAEVRFNNTWVLRNAGSVGYGSDLYTNYLKKSIAKSLPVINGAGQSKFPLNADLGVLQADQFQISHPAYSLNTLLTRSISVKDNSLIDKVTFRGGSQTVGTRGQVYNFECTFSDQLREISAVDTGKLSSINPAFSYWSDVRLLAAATNFSLNISCSGQRFRLEILTNDPVEVFFGKLPNAAKNVIREGLYINGGPKLNMISVNLQPLL